MNIKNLKIQGIAGIKNELYLEFNDGLNIICGINGTCKTTILECIARFFYYHYSRNLKKNKLSEIGKFTATFKNTNKSKREYTIKEFLPDINEPTQSTENGEQLLYLKTNRLFQYNKIDSVPSDPISDGNQQSQVNNNGISFENGKGWFLNRYLYAPHSKALTSEQITNLETAKKCFNVLDESVSFSYVKADSNDIMVNSQQGEIYFEYLSAGYKSCLYILLGVIKEIEFRFKNPTIIVEDFDGIILIDEVDLHLHPIWQSRIVQALKETFPKSQIIVTTHSPHIIQAAKADEVIPLIIDENGDIAVKKFQTGQYGFQGWTLEEILEDVMGMENTRSDFYNETLRDFNEAIKNEDNKEAHEKYEILKEMVHPGSHLRKLFEIQMVGIEDEDD